MEIGPKPLSKVRGWEQADKRADDGGLGLQHRGVSTKEQGNMRGSWEIGGVQISGSKPRLPISVLISIAKHTGRP